MLAFLASPTVVFYPNTSDAHCSLQQGTFSVCGKIMLHSWQTVTEDALWAVVHPQQSRDFTPAMLHKLLHPLSSPSTSSFSLSIHSHRTDFYPTQQQATAKPQHSSSIKPHSIPVPPTKKPRGQYLLRNTLLATTTVVDLAQAHTSP